MFNIQSFLNKHTQKINKDVLLYDSIVELVKQETGILLKKEDLSIKKDILFIKTTPIKKNIILLKKDNILKSLKILNIIDLR